MDRIALELNEWTARNGQVRRYVNNWTRLVALEYQRYNTGNISSATLHGEYIANACCRRILAAKVWLDEADQVHIDYWSELYELSADQVATAVAEAYAAQTAPAADNDDDQNGTMDAPGVVSALRTAGRTARQIAQMVGCSVSTIYRWARGACRPSARYAPTLAALAG